MATDPRRNKILEAIRSRRVTRFFEGDPIDRSILQAIVETGRWSPAAGNRRFSRFVVVTTPRTIEAIQMLAPGIDGLPTALIVICVDWELAGSMGVDTNHPTVYYDTAMAAQNMLLAAHALDIGAGPVTSFSKAAVSLLLNLPEWMSPAMILCLGHPDRSKISRKTKPARPLRWQDITWWERYSASEPDDEPA